MNNNFKKQKKTLNIIFFIILSSLLLGIIFAEEYHSKVIFALIMIGISAFRFVSIVLIIIPMQKIILKNETKEVISKNNRIQYKEGRTKIFDSISRESEKLEIENKDLKDLGVQKTTLLANISHEIKTPMNGIIGLTNLLFKTELSEKQDDILQKIKFSSNTLLETLEGMLLFSKAENGELKVKNQEFDLRKSIDSIGDIFISEIRDKKLELHFDIDLDIPKIIKGDFLKIKQILTNLIWNAIKFTNEGEVILKIKIVKDKSNKIQLEFSVKDTGIGIEEEHLNNIFSAFTQLNKDANKNYHGTGLGLNISQKLVEAMGGLLTVESKVGKGSLFSFDLEFEYDKIDTSTNTSKLSSGYNILVVDDNYSARILTKTMLEFLKCTVTTAKSGKDALDKLNDIYAKHETIDFVITDFIMPEMSGIDLSNEIRKIPKYGKIDIIMLTAFGKKSELEKKFNCTSIDGYIEKPLKLDLIKKLIDDLSKRNKVKKTQTIMSQTVILNRALHGKTVLIVEDNDINLQITEEIISDFGLFYFSTKDGKQGLEKYIEKHKEIDAILMDCNMPVMDGFESTKKIRIYEKENNIKEVPIIALSADDPENINYLEIGMNDFITKPINVLQLNNCLEKCMNIKLKTENIKRPELTITSVERDGAKLLTFKGLDILEGLKRVNGKVKLYQKLLEDFAIKHSDFSISFNEKLNNNNIDEALKLIHGLKGVAGNLSITEIAKISQTINDKLKNEDIDEVKSLSKELEVSLNEFISQFNIEKKEDKKTVGKDTFDYNSIKEELNELKNMLAKSDFSSEAKITELKEKYPDCFILDKITSLLRDFNFSEAEKTISDIL